MMQVLLLPTACSTLQNAAAPHCMQHAAKCCCSPLHAARCKMLLLPTACSTLQNAAALFMMSAEEAFKKRGSVSGEATSASWHSNAQSLFLMRTEQAFEVAVAQQANAVGLTAPGGCCKQRCNSTPAEACCQRPQRTHSLFLNPTSFVEQIVMPGHRTGLYKHNMLQHPKVIPSSLACTY